MGIFGKITISCMRGMSFSSVASLMDEAGEEDGVDAGGDHSCWTLESNVLEVMMTGRGLATVL